MAQLYRWVARSPFAVSGAVFVAVAYWGWAVVFVPAPAMPAPVIHAPVAAPTEHHVQSATVTGSVDCAKVPCIALTFDDGPNAAVTPQVLDILARHHARATFFLIGLHVPGNEELVRRMQREGHEIGNHTWSHRDLATLSPQEAEDEINRAQETITATGVPAPHLLRPPYGAADTMVRGHAPLTIVMWNIDPEDWKAKKPEKIIDHVMTHARAGAIIDMHDIRQVTADSLDSILTGLGLQYNLVTVSELLDLAPGQPGVFYAR